MAVTVHSLLCSFDQIQRPTSTTTGNISYIFISQDLKVQYNNKNIIISKKNAFTLQEPFVSSATSKLIDLSFIMFLRKKKTENKQKKT